MLGFHLAPCVPCSCTFKSCRVDCCRDTQRRKRMYDKDSPALCRLSRSLRGSSRVSHKSRASSHTPLHNHAHAYVHMSMHAGQTKGMQPLPCDGSNRTQPRSSMLSLHDVVSTSRVPNMHAKHAATHAALPIGSSCDMNPHGCVPRALVEHAPPHSHQNSRPARPTSPGAIPWGAVRSDGAAPISDASPHRKMYNGGTAARRTRRGASDSPRRPRLRPSHPPMRRRSAGIAGRAALWQSAPRARQYCTSPVRCSARKAHATTTRPIPR